MVNIALIEIKQELLQMLISHKVTFFRSFFFFLMSQRKGFSISFGAGEGTEISRDGVTVRGRLIALSTEDGEAAKNQLPVGGKGS